MYAFLYFKAETWGTVSDWIMILVTMVTAYYLYKTLRSQKEVQQIQYELFKMERVRFKESIRPVLTYTSMDNFAKPCEGDKRILTISVQNESNCIALDISKIVSESEHTKQVFIPMGFPEKFEQLVKGDKPLFFHFLISSDPIVPEFLVFLVKYTDVAGTTYSQRVICICDKYGIDIHPYRSEVVDES